MNPKRRLTVSVEDYLKAIYALTEDGTAASTSAIADVGTFPRDRSPFGAYDLAGNVAEWTDDITGDLAVIKGGSFDLPRYRALATAYGKRRADLPYRDVGFRCVMELGWRR